MLNLLAMLYFLFVGSLFASEVKLPVATSYPLGIEKNLSSIKKIKVLVFLNRTCPCTQQNIPYINKLIQEFPSVEFIGVHSKLGSSVNEIKEVIDNYKPKFEVIDDNNLVIANLLKANRTPQAFVFNKDNELLYSGGVTERTNPENAKKLYLKNALAEATTDHEITEKETRSLGCVILR
ncbi:MAG: redoxin domain-containing protein [Bdellovibrionales bacterium]|nr:redoxin domain-containing protein [Bdellovibrionales bacterium]